ncbi:hypothetical protein OIO90_001185 [Microbotryomycetes sp. JL221]|nr:hypothetical protein OIO90_001185 [Microbotryomycetes sp. JL221]
MTKHALHSSGYGGKIYTLEFDTSNSSLVVTSSTDAGKAPTWLTRHPSKPILYTGDEFAEPKGQLMAFDVDTNSGALSLKSTKKCAPGPVSFAISQNEKFLFSANYGSGSIDSVRLEEDGTFRSSDRQDQHFDFVGAGPNTQRQEKPHPHQATLEPSGKWLFVPDLGADAIRVFNIFEDEIQQADQVHILPGSGPRHVIFSTPDQRRVSTTSTTNGTSSSSSSSSSKRPTLCYLVNELTNTVTCFEVVPPPSKHDHLKLRSVGKPDISFLPSSHPALGQQGWTGAELSLTPDRQFLIISNRSPDEPTSDTDHLTIFKLQSNGHIVTTEAPMCKAVNGRGLRHFSLSPAIDGHDEGEFVAVAAQKTNEVIMFKRQGSELTEVARVKDVAEPTCVVW